MPQTEAAMYGIAGLIIFILDIIALVDCLKSSMDAGKKVLWVLLILILPVLGMLLYFLLAKPKVA
jgi:hypothetical protein